MTATKAATFQVGDISSSTDRIKELNIRKERACRDLSIGGYLWVTPDFVRTDSSHAFILRRRRTNKIELPCTLANAIFGSWGGTCT